MADDGVDWTGASEQMVRDIHAQGEAFLQAQFQSALASDQRASAMAGLLITLSTAAIAGVVALSETLAREVVIGGVVTAAMLLLAAAFAGWAARPIDFWFPGSRPEQWYDGKLESSVDMIGGAAELVQFAIDENEDFMAHNQTAIRVSFVLAVASLPVGLATWWLA